MATTVQKQKAPPMPNLDFSQAKHQADVLYAAHKNGEVVDLPAAASYCFYVSGQLGAEDTQRTQYLNRALELDLAQQTQRQQAYDDTIKQKEAAEREQERTATITLFRASPEFQALKAAVVNLYAKVGNTNQTFMRGQKPSWLENINKKFSILEKGPNQSFHKALDALIELAREWGRRAVSVFVVPVFEAAIVLKTAVKNHLIDPCSISTSMVPYRQTKP